MYVDRIPSDERAGPGEITYSCCIHLSLIARMGFLLGGITALF